MSWPDRREAPGVGGISAQRPPDGARADEALHAVIEATRALLWIRSRADAAAAARELVEALGGTIEPAATSTSEAIPVDVSFGEGEPMLPSAPPSTVSRMLLERYMPAFVRDANQALELSESSERLAEQAAIDPLTGLASRRMLGRVIGRLRPSQSVIMIDLDHFKDVNDTLGHHEGDRVLRALGRAITSSLRATDTAGRYGGEEFVVIIEGDGAEPFLQRLQSTWLQSRPHPVTFSAGVAPALPDPARALEAADRAMYRAKGSGRDRWCLADADEYL